MQRNQLRRDVMFAAAASAGLLTVVLWAGIPSSIALAFSLGVGAGVGMLAVATFTTRRGGQ